MRGWEICRSTPGLVSTRRAYLMRSCMHIDSILLYPPRTRTPPYTCASTRYTTVHVPVEKPVDEYETGYPRHRQGHTHLAVSYHYGKKRGRGGMDGWMAKVGLPRSLPILSSRQWSRWSKEASPEVRVEEVEVGGGEYSVGVLVGRYEHLYWRHHTRTRRVSP